MNATIINNSVSIANNYTMPNDVKVLEVDYDGTHNDYMNAPVGLEFNGVKYGKSSHNSDTMRIIYRSDKAFATK